MARKFKSVDRLLAQAVEETIRDLDPANSDTAAVQLARHYAEIVDRAESAVDDADRALREVDPEDVDTRKYLYRLRAKVDAQAVAAEIGPKLLAVLDSLGATPAARAKMKGGAPTGGPSQLDRMRAARGA